MEQDQHVNLSELSIPDQDPQLHLPLEHFQVLHSSAKGGCSHVHTVPEDVVQEGCRPPEIYSSARHQLQPRTTSGSSSPTTSQPWRMKQRMRTVGAALVYCLNIGVDPPDLVRPTPCARKQCWLDPFSLPPQKALSTLGNRLQRQYERWQPRARYKQSLDQTDADLKRLCLSLRRGAKIERVLLHYNGHGVPRPTKNGEIWAFNQNYTQYVPVSVYDLASWLGTPSIYVFDVSGAGELVSSLQSLSASKDLLVLAACSSQEQLPLNPSLPADIFTACLTTPIRMSLDWFVGRSLLCQVPRDQVSKLPGRPNDRKSPFGELNWVFTAVTDTIAWTSFPADVFQRLFRQDLMVASLFRNYLLAERILGSYNRTTQSLPPLPQTRDHEMWQAWDFASEFALAELSKYLGDPSHVFRPTGFFGDQLTAFEVWLEHAREDCGKPVQLPVVLQVLLSQTHRLRALRLLARFLDKGAWAVRLALSVGIFPYVLKLLQSPGAELKKVLVFVWARLLAVDGSCAEDLLKDRHHLYFTSQLENSSSTTSALQKVLCCWTLARLADAAQGQSLLLEANSCELLLHVVLGSEQALARRWGVLGLARVLECSAPGRLAALQLGVDRKLVGMLGDPAPEVRAALAYALSCMFSPLPSDGEYDLELAAQICEGLGGDGSSLVRSELLAVLHRVLLLHRDVESSSSAQTILNTLYRLVHDPLASIADAAQRALSLVTSSSSGSDASSASACTPPSSSIYAWSCAQLDQPLLGVDEDFWFLPGNSDSSTSFTESSSKPSESSDCLDALDQESFPGSLDEYYQHLATVRFRRDRNLQTTKEASRLRCSEPRPLEDQVALPTEFHPALVRFHPYENLLAASDEGHSLAFWDYEEGIMLNAFSNQTAKKPLISSSSSNNSKLTALVFPNHLSSSLLLTGADDGVVRVWKNVHRKARQTLAASFAVGFPSEVSAFSKAPLLLDWQSTQSKLLAGHGDIVHVWDVQREQRTLHVPLGSESQVRSLCSDFGGNVVYLGLADGTVRFVDLRSPKEGTALICRHPGKVVSVTLQRKGRQGGKLVSAGVRGNVIISDPRNPETSAKRIRAHPKTSPLTTLAVHEHAPLLATGSSKQFVNILDLEGNLINRIRHHDGFLGQRIGPVQCLSFHPNKMILASAGKESFVSLYSPTRHQ